MVLVIDHSISIHFCTRHKAPLAKVSQKLLLLLLLLYVGGGVGRLNAASRAISWHTTLFAGAN